MTSPAGSGHLAALFLPTATGSGTQRLVGGTCTVWAGIAPYNSTVVVGTVTYTNLPVVNPAAMSTGLVLLITSPAGPIILGRLYPGS